MRTLVLVLSLILSPSCGTTVHEPRPAAAPPAIELQLPAGQSEVTVLAFLRECQRASGRNFTFEASIAEELETKTLRIFGPARIADASFDEFVASMLSVAGYTCRSLGPEHLRVLEVRRAS